MTNQSLDFLRIELELKRNLWTLSSFQGSDPRAATCRGKLQSRRCKLNQEINKELRLRAGAENLYKVRRLTHCAVYIEISRLSIYRLLVGRPQQIASCATLLPSSWASSIPICSCSRNSWPSLTHPWRSIRARGEWVLRQGGSIDSPNLWKFLMHNILMENRSRGQIMKKIPSPATIWCFLTKLWDFETLWESENKARG